MTRYSIESRTRKYVKGCGFLSFARNLSNKYGKQLLNTGIDVLKTATKKVAHKAAEATGDFIGIKIADKIVKPVEEIIIPPEKREEILKHLDKYCKNGRP